MWGSCYVAHTSSTANFLSKVISVSLYDLIQPPVLSTGRPMLQGYAILLSLPQFPQLCYEGDKTALVEETVVRVSSVERQKGREQVCGQYQ